MTPNTVCALAGVLLAAVLLGSAAPSPSDRRQRPVETHIPLNAMRLPEHVAEQLAHQMETGPTGQFHSLIHQALATSAVPITFNATSYTLVGTVTMGSQAQSVAVRIDTLTQDFYFLYPSTTTTSDSGSTRFDYSSSTSATVTSQLFYASWNQVNGNSTVTDTIQFNSVSISGLTFGEATNYQDYIGQRPVAGNIGLAPFNGLNSTNITGFGPQLAASSSSPLASVSVVVSAVNLAAGSITQTGQLTVGAEDSDTCTAGTYTYVPSDTMYAPAFRVDSISGQTPSGDALSLTMNANRSMAIIEMMPGMIGSNQYLQLFVNATGLTAQGNSYYNMSCDDVANVGNLTLNLAGGATLTVSPLDYIFKNVTSDGTVSCGTYLYPFGIDESDGSSLPNVLGQGFLNNHCYTHNYSAGTIGIASAQQQTMAVVNS